MSTKRKGKKETKQESSTQYKVVDPISLADLENIHTRKGKYPTRPPPFGQLTWEEAKREKEENLKKLRNTHSPFSSIYQFSIFLYASLQIKLHRGMSLSLGALMHI